MEIERKFVIVRPPPDLEAFPKQAICQGYIAVTEDNTEVRVRSKGDRFYLTIKKGEGLARHEVELSLGQSQFDQLWSLTAGRRIEKTRYAISINDHCIELDIYHSFEQAFITAEVEFQSVTESEEFKPPDWFGPEVTEDSRYKNKNLALHGPPDWEQKTASA